MGDDTTSRSIGRRNALAAIGATAGLVGLGGRARSVGLPTGEPEESLEETTSWPQFMHDAANTGYNPRASPPTDDVATRWTDRSDDASQLAVARNTVYVGGAELRALAATDGTERWSRGGGSGNFGSPAVGGDRVYAGLRFENSDDRDAVVSVNADTGEERWRFAEDGSFDYDSLTVAAGTVYATPQRPHRDWLYAIDAETGTKRWAVEIGSPGVVGTGTAHVAFVDGTVYVPGAQSLHARDARTGDELWRNETVDFSNEPDATPAVVDGTVYVGARGADSGHGDRFFAVDAADGSIEWRFDPGNEGDGDGSGFWHAPAVANGTVYVDRWANDCGLLYALNATDGSVEWSAELRHATNPAVSNGVVYAGDVAFDAGTGTRRWRTDLDVGTATVVGDTVYAVGDIVAALVEGTGTATPTERGG